MSAIYLDLMKQAYLLNCGMVTFFKFILSFGPLKLQVEKKSLNLQIGCYRGINKSWLMKNINWLVGIQNSELREHHLWYREILARDKDVLRGRVQDSTSYGNSN
jgi:hypothetical protein